MLACKDTVLTIEWSIRPVPCLLRSLTYPYRSNKMCSISQWSIITWSWTNLHRVEKSMAYLSHPNQSTRGRILSLLDSSRCRCSHSTPLIQIMTTPSIVIISKTRIESINTAVDNISRIYGPNRVWFLIHHLPSLGQLRSNKSPRSSAIALWRLQVQSSRIMGSWFPSKNLKYSAWVLFFPNRKLSE